MKSQVVTAVHFVSLWVVRVTNFHLYFLEFKLSSYFDTKMYTTSIHSNNTHTHTRARGITLSMYFHDISSKLPEVLYIFRDCTVLFSLKEKVYSCK